mgnify:CR=1 FL=1
MAGLARKTKIVQRLELQRWYRRIYGTRAVIAVGPPLPPSRRMSPTTSKKPQSGRLSRPVMFSSTIIRFFKARPLTENLVSTPGSTPAVSIPRPDMFLPSINNCAVFNSKPGKWSWSAVSPPR